MYLNKNTCQPDFEGFLRALRFPPSSKLTLKFQFDLMQDLPENHFQVSGASWVNIINYYYYYLYFYGLIHVNQRLHLFSCCLNKFFAVFIDIFLEFRALLSKLIIWGFFLLYLLVVVFLTLREIMLPTKLRPFRSRSCCNAKIYGKLKLCWIKKFLSRNTRRW